MAGVLEFMRRSRKKLVSQHLPPDTSHPKVLELQTAKELLAETFGISVLEVEEMILLRCEKKGAVARELLSGVRIVSWHGYDASILEWPLLLPSGTHPSHSQLSAATVARWL